MPRNEKLEIVSKYLGSSCPRNYFMSLNLKKGYNFSKELASHENTFPIVFSLRRFTTYKFSGEKCMLSKEKKEKDGNQQFTEKNKQEEAGIFYLFTYFLSLF